MESEKVEMKSAITLQKDNTSYLIFIIITTTTTV